MKDVKTNLENMENILGRNMIAMENNMEDRMKTIEDQTKIFEKTIKNTATTGSCYVTSAPRTIQASIYDAQTPWSSYKKQFEAAATANLWEEEQKATALVIALRGAALEILQTLSEEDRNRYSVLSAAQNFGDEHLKKVFVAQLKTRIQKTGKFLQEFEADIKRLVRLAYPDAPPSFQESLATETFANGIRDGKVKKILQASTFQTSSDALISCAGNGGGVQFFKNMPQSQSGRTRDGRK